MPQHEAGRVISSLKSGEVEPECNFVGSLANDTSNEDSQDYLPEHETVEQTISQKFLTAHANMQASLSREQALATVGRVLSTRLG